MKIKILTCCAGMRFSFTAGETVDTDDVTAQDLIQAGHAKMAGGKQTFPPVDPLKEEKADDKSDNAAVSGAGKSGGVPDVDAGVANQSGTGTDGKQPAKSGA